VLDPEVTDAGVGAAEGETTASLIV
jgi:hypothetical protein